MSTYYMNTELNAYDVQCTNAEQAHESWQDICDRLTADYVSSHDSWQDAIDGGADPADLPEPQPPTLPDEPQPPNEPTLYTAELVDETRVVDTVDGQVVIGAGRLFVTPDNDAHAFALAQAELDALYTAAAQVKL